MHELTGCFVKSIAGRDIGKYYVIIDTHNEYVYLVDVKLEPNHQKKI